MWDKVNVKESILTHCTFYILYEVKEPEQWRFEWRFCFLACISYISTPKLPIPAGSTWLRFIKLALTQKVRDTITV